MYFDFRYVAISERVLAATAGIADSALRIQSIARMVASNSLKEFGVIGFELVFQTADGRFLQALVPVQDGNKEVVKKMLAGVFEQLGVIRYCISMEASSVELGNAVLISQFEPGKQPCVWLFRQQKLKRDQFALPFHKPNRAESYWDGIVQRPAAAFS